MSNNYTSLNGWTPNPAAVKQVLSELPYPYFRQAAPHLFGDERKDIYLYKAWSDLLGSYPAYVAQAIGDCTSFGTGRGVDLLQAIQIVLQKKAETWKETCTEYLYGCGRELANMLRSNGDGCYGAALAKAVKQYGVVPREAVGPYSGQRAKQWGYQGSPAEWKEQGKKHPVQTYSLVQTWDELYAALSNGYPVVVCSNQGFQLRRNEKGIAEAQGNWAHCMLICGLMYVGTPDECAVIANSWGDEACQGPTPNQIPLFCFGARKRVVERMLAAQDTWALSSFDGYPGQPLPSEWTFTGWSFQ